MKNTFLLIFLCLSFLSFSQRGKHGAGNIAALNIRVNEYTTLTSVANVGNTTINVASSNLNTNGRFASNLQVGDLIMIIQMQGAIIKTFGAVLGQDSTYGNILNYNGAGNYEFAQVYSIPNATSIVLDCGLTYSYSTTGKTQIVRVPRYSSLTVNAGASLTADTWNGTIGGILAAEVNGLTTINGTVTTTGLGFRGGIAINNGGSGGTRYVDLGGGANEGGEKGESIAGSSADYLALYGGQYARGAAANGGGGGDSHNAGGGGGGNGGNPLTWSGYGVINAAYTAIYNLEYPGRGAVVSSGGGRGGYDFSAAGLNPTTVGPNISTWNGDGRKSNGGFGGRPLDYSTGKLFLGGGGGAGHCNNLSASNTGGTGGIGGGMIYFITYGSVSGTGLVVSNGNNGVNATGPNPGAFSSSFVGNDSGGGGGAGGTVIFNTSSSVSGITINANGGNGGNQIIVKGGFAGTVNEAEGPGGGGGGGYIAISAGAPVQTALGAISGTTNAAPMLTNFPPNGSTNGAAGNTNQAIILYTLTANPVTVCVNNAATLNASSNNASASFIWYDNLTGPTQIGTGAVYTTTVFTTVGTYTVFAGMCPGNYRVPVVITVINGPTLTPTSATVCAGQTGTISVTGATTYTWSSGSNNSTITASPLATTAYTVTGSIGTCTSATTATITVNTSGSISATSSTICSGQSATLAAGAAVSYTWSNGATTQSIVVNPTSTSIYTINATLAGGCVVTNTCSVTVNSTPTLITVSSTICPGQTGTISASGATNYTWSTGANTTSISATPATSTTYTVIGANGTCTTSNTASITVSAIGSIVINSPSICAGQSATLTGGSALTYTWSTGANTQTVSVNPITTTVYTLNATLAGGCSVIGTSTVTVNSNPLLNPVSATICAGQTGTISASGATTYTWSNGSNSATTTASPITNSTYTVIGANGTCTSSATASITVNTSGTISVTSATICSGQTATLTSGAAQSYTWNTAANTQSITVNPISTTVYTLNATLAGGCLVSNTTIVNVSPNPTVTVNTASVCVGQSATLIAGGAINYLWSNGAATSTNNLSPVVTTVYTVTGTSGNCSSTATTSIFVTQTPTLSAASITICAGQTATLTAAGATTYTWDPLPGSNVISSSFTASPASTTIYNVIGATNGCTATTNASIVIGTNLSISVNTPTICSGQTATLTAVSTATNYLWSNGATTPSIFVNPISNTTYTVTGTKGTCTGSMVANVFVNNLPALTINSNPICVGGSATITANGANTYSWSNGSNNTSSITVSPAANTTYTVIGEINSCTLASVYVLSLTPTPTITAANVNICNGATATLIATGATNYTWLPSGTQSNSITVSPSVVSTYTVIGDNGSCSAQTTATVFVANGLIAPVNNVNICEGQTATIGTTLNGTSYLWSNGATTQSISINPNSTTTYSVLVVVGSCSYTGNSTITVVPTPTILLNSASICIGHTATLSASGATNGYTWNPGNLTGNSISLSPTVTTNYVVTSANGVCPATATTQISVYTKPILALSPHDDLVCPNTPLTFSATGANIYEWYVNGNYYFGNPLTVVPTKNSTVTLVGSNAACSSTAITTINVSDVAASFNPESNYVDYPGNLTFTNTSSGATEIYWDFGNGQTSTNNTPNVYYEYPGKYLVALVAKNGLGCIDTALYVIEAGCGKGDFYIPNTFTPNGDGLNDSFEVLGGSCVTQFKGSVFDRWGTEIFKWKNITDSWDGNYGGQKVEIGVYNYIVTYTLYNGKVFTKTGHIAIIR
jgi:gliding motility-associated-like protein